MNYFMLALMATLMVCGLRPLARRVRYGQASFLDGAYCGALLFIVAPLCLLSVLAPLGLVDSYFYSRFMNDDGTLYIYAAAVCASLLASYLVVAARKRDDGFGRRLIPNWVLVTSYFVLSVTVFFLSGRMVGGHWHEANDALYSNSAIATLIGNFYNVLRCTVFGFLAYSGYVRPSVRTRALGLMLIIAVFDVAISANRITLLFFATSCVLMFGGVRKKHLAVGLILLPAASVFSAVYPVFRGIFWVGGLSIDNVAYSLDASLSNMRIDASYLADGVLSVFESSNMDALSFVLSSYGGDGAPLLMGETVIVKSMTFFLPTAIWAEKPLGFGPRLGEEVYGSDMLALNSTLAGEFFGNFGWLAIVLLPLALCLADAIWTRMCRHFSAPALPGFFIALAAWRFEFSFVVISLFCLAVLLTCVSWLGAPTRRTSIGLAGDGRL